MDDIQAWLVLDQHDNAFVFGDKDDAERKAIDMCEETGSETWPIHPLGFIGECELIGGV